MNIKNKKTQHLGPIGLGIIAVILTLTLLFGKHLFFPKNESLRLQDSAVKKMDLNKVKTSVDLKNNDYTGVGNLKTSQLQLSKKIDKLESKISRIKINQDFGVISDSVDGNGNNNGGDDMEGDESQAVTNFQNQITLLNNTLLSEFIDHNWSEMAIEDVYESFQSSSLEKYTVLAADCRSTMCRIEVMLNEVPPEDGFHELGDSLPWNGEMFFQADDESGEAIIYLARVNHSLPRLTE